MNEIINYIQISAIVFATGVVGWIYIAYIRNLYSTVKLKDEQIKTVEKNISFLKERLAELEKKSPENMEKTLNERIKTREDEIARLGDDKKNNRQEIEQLNLQAERLKSDLEKTKDIRRIMEFLDFDDDEFFSTNAKFEIEKIGVVVVDSGQLMITDPCYIDSHWKYEPYDDIRLLKDSTTGNVFQFRKDFNNYNNKINGYEETVQELITSGRFEPIKVDNSDNISFSYSGACHASMSEEGYGALPLELGHEGAGIVVATVRGDGMYSVYAEKHDGKIARVYFNLV